MSSGEMEGVLDNAASLVVSADEKTAPNDQAGSASVRFNDDVKVKSIESNNTQGRDKDYYFKYYANLQNQANMIGDIARTATYRKAILGNTVVAFRDKVVLDVGAGSGILSFLSVQAGAKHVIALEASGIADKMQVLISGANTGRGNPELRNKIRLIRGMVEDDKVQTQILQSGKVDTIISEPIGVMLFHERMVESFLLARDLLLKPGGQVFPSGGQIYFCPFSDEALYIETDQKAQFFNTTLFGTDFSDLYSHARAEVFAQPVIGMFPPSSLVAVPCPPKAFNFNTCAISDIVEFSVPIDFIATKTTLVHGLASWFDLSFCPLPLSTPEVDDESIIEAWNYPITPNPNWQWLSHDSPLNPGPTPPAPQNGLDVTLSTGPSAPRTHWQQARLLLPEPLAVNKGERVIGSVHFIANDARSYDITIDLCVDRPGPGVQPNPLQRTGKYNLAQQLFNYSYNPDVAGQLGSMLG